MRIAVIIPAWNAATTLAEAVRSVLAQSLPPTQILVVDDGSDDATAAVASRFSAPALHLLRQRHAGVSAARNRGIVAAESDAVLFLDADDRLAPDALAVLAATLAAAPRAVAATGAWAWLPADGAPAAPPRYRPHPLPQDLLATLVVRNRFANGGHVLIRRDAALRAGGFDPALCYGEDWAFFVHLAALGPFAFAATRAPLLFVRSRPEGAYRRCAADPAAFAPCMAAIFGCRLVGERLGTGRLAALRRRAEAENAWIVGRERVRQGRPGEGRRFLRRSVHAAPSLRRLGLLCLAAIAPLLPPAWRGPFRPYGDAPSPPPLPPPPLPPLRPTPQPPLPPPPPSAPPPGPPPPRHAGTAYDRSLASSAFPPLALGPDGTRS